MSVLLFLLACQSYSSGLGVICDAPERCAECREAPPEQEMILLARHVDDNLSNAQAREVFDALGNASVEAKVEILRAEASEQGLSSCPLADRWAARATQDAAAP